MLPTPADWSARHSVTAVARRTVALVNALTGEPTSSAAQVAAVLREHGEPEPVELTAADLDELRAAALLLREVFAAADVDGAATALNRLLAAHTGRLRLTSHDGGTPGTRTSTARTTDRGAPGC